MSNNFFDTTTGKPVTVLYEANVYTIQHAMTNGYNMIKVPGGATEPYSRNVYNHQWFTISNVQPSATVQPSENVNICGGGNYTNTSKSVYKYNGGDSLYNNEISTVTFTFPALGTQLTETYSTPFTSKKGVAYLNLYVANANYSVICLYSTQSILIESPMVCFKEGSEILTDKGYQQIQNLRTGDLVQTLKDGFLPICMIGKKDIIHIASNVRIKDQLYKLSNDKYPELFKDLILTGAHSVLVDDFISENQKERAIQVLGDVYVTDKKYRLPAVADDRAIIYEMPGEYTIYHLALENNDYYMNYGIYANGLLVETSSKRYLKELSDMTII